MIDLPSFFILNEEGESILPDSFHLKRVNNRESILYLDANICLDVLNLFDNKVLSNKALINVETLILFCQQNKIEVMPKFGAMELCYNRDTYKLNLKKYTEFINKITYTFDKPFNKLSNLNQISFNYFVEAGEMDAKAFEAFSPLLLTSYITLLKIYILCKKNNPQKSNVLKNIKLFLHWCDKHLNTSLASEIQLAIRIFGGISEFKKMIAFDKKADIIDNILKPIWGTAWDFFHMRMIHFSLKNTDINYNTYFVTQDRNFSALFKSCKLEGWLTSSNQPFMSFVSNVVNIQYKDEYILEEVCNIVKSFSLKRSINSRMGECLDINLLYSLKTDLENDINKLNQLH